MANETSSRTPWVTERDAILEPQVAESGVASERPTTVIEVFKGTVERYPAKEALYQEKDGAWVTWTWQQYWDECARFAKSLISLGFPVHGAINVIGFNSPEWIFANNGAILAGGIAAGIYTTNLPDACHYISEHSEAEVVVVENAAQLAKYQEIAERLPRLKALVIYAEAVPEGATAGNVPIYTWEDFQQLGADVPDDELQARMDAQQPGHCCTLIYTSGTTGPPKAVMISHDNVTWTARRAAHALGSIGPNDRMVSYLPLSHIAAQMLDIHNPLATGCSVHFARPDALKGSLGQTLVAVRPTVFFGVPRVWEKIHAKMLAIGAQTTGVKKTLSTWAKSQGADRSRLAQFGAGGGAPCGFSCAHSLVLSKIKLALGLDQCNAAFTGAAPIPREVLDYFASIDIPLFELFGQSECTGPHTICVPGAWKIGTCGRAMDGTESRIADDSGEIQYRGRHIMMGYLNNAEKTAETITDEGWLCSGDVGRFDEDGFLSITGRIKELIITAGGENIPPVLIEDNFKRSIPCLANCCVIGDRRKFLSILLCPAVELDEEGGPTENLAPATLKVGQEIGSSATTLAQLRDSEEWTRYFNEGMERANGLTTSNAQKIRKWTIISDFSVPGGELTPTLKLKRPVVATKFEADIEGMYSS